MTFHSYQYVPNDRGFSVLKDGKETYQVWVEDHSVRFCNCPWNLHGGGRKKDCKHIKQVTEILKERGFTQVKRQITKEELEAFGKRMEEDKKNLWEQIRKGK
jgi:uncharacterized protein (DUF885 family)